MSAPGGGAGGAGATGADGGAEGSAERAGAPGGMPGMGGMNPAMMQEMGGAGGAGADSANAQPPRERYANELEQLKDMGFTDEETNLQMLSQSNGNVDLAIERLIASQGDQ